MHTTERSLQLMPITIIWHMTYHTDQSSDSIIIFISCCSYSSCTAVNNHFYHHNDTASLAERNRSDGRSST